VSVIVSADTGVAIVMCYVRKGRKEQSKPAGGAHEEGI
jgi:hypothetical protein